MARKLSHFD